MSEVHTIGLDLAKSVFQVHGADGSGAVVFRKRLRRKQALVFSLISRAVWLRWRLAVAPITGGVSLLGSSHKVKLIPPIYVKPFVKRQKNDAADAEAICEAANLGPNGPHLDSWREPANVRNSGNPQNLILTLAFAPWSLAYSPKAPW